MSANGKSIELLKMAKILAKDTNGLPLHLTPQKEARFFGQAASLLGALTALPVGAGAWGRNIDIEAMRNIPQHLAE